MLTYKPHFFINIFLQLTKMPPVSTHSIETVRAKTVLILFPTRDGIVFYLGTTRDEVIETNLHILYNFLVGHAIIVYAMVTGHEEHKYVMVVVRDNITLLVFVIVSAGWDEIDDSYAIFPKLVLKADNNFIENTKTNALDSCLIGIRQIGQEFDFLFLQQPQRHTYDHLLTVIIVAFFSRNFYHFSHIVYLHNCLVKVYFSFAAILLISCFQ